MRIYIIFTSLTIINVIFWLAFGLFCYPRRDLRYPAYTQPPYCPFQIDVVVKLTCDAFYQFLYTRFIASAGVHDDFLSILSSFTCSCSWPQIRPRTGAVEVSYWSHTDIVVISRSLTHIFSLNTNQAAIDPLQYDGAWEDHEYQPSPDNWRFPVYTIFLDRFSNGDPTNDNANGTAYEHDLISNQFRNGGDIKGLLDSLDYLQGMGIKVGND